MSKIVNRNWNILQINTEFLGVFQSKLMITLRCNKNFQEIIGDHTIKQRNAFEKVCIDNMEDLCPVVLQDHHNAVKIVYTQTFMNQQTKRKFNTFHRLT